MIGRFPYGAALVLIAALSLVLTGCTPKGGVAGLGGGPPTRSMTGVPEERGIVMFLNDAAVVEWSDDESSVLLAFRGQDFHRGNLERPRPGILVLFIDGVAFQIVDLDSSLVTTKFASNEELLSKHRQWELEYWNRTVGAPFEAHTERIPGCDCADASLWQIAWPEEIRAARNVKATSQLYLTFVAGTRIVVVSSAVMDGESVTDRLRYLTAVAHDARVLPGRIDQEELRRWLEENGLKISPSESDPG